jgi:hypothetical protein
MVPDHTTTVRRCPSRCRSQSRNCWRNFNISRPYHLSGQITIKFRLFLVINQARRGRTAIHRNRRMQCNARCMIFFADELFSIALVHWRLQCYWCIRKMASGISAWIIASWINWQWKTSTPPGDWWATRWVIRIQIVKQDGLMFWLSSDLIGRRWCTEDII